MKITDVETILLTVPSKWKWGTRPSTCSFVRVKTDSGLVGLGESYVGWYVPEIVPPLVEHFRGVVLGENPFEINRLWRKMFVKAMRWGHVGPPITIIGAIEIALWDILGKALEAPVYQLLGGLAHDRMRCYASLSGPTISAAKELVDAGFTAIKVGHAGGMVQPSYMGAEALVRQEREKAGAMRKALGEKVDLMLDPAMTFRRRSWSADVALQVLKAMEDYHLLWYEQPVLQTNINEYVRIRQLTSTPLAAGENGTTLHDYKPFFEHRVIDIVQPDASWCGGISECMKIIAAAEAHDMRVAPHSFSGAVGLAANYHVAFASRNCFIVKAPTRDSPIARGLIENAFEFRDGYIHPSDGPGLGVELTDELIEKYPFVPGSGISHARSPFPRPVEDWQPTVEDVVSWAPDFSAD